MLASELFALAMAFDIVAVIKEIIDWFLAQHWPLIPLIITTDSKSLYDCLVKLGTTMEK